MTSPRQRMFPYQPVDDMTRDVTIGVLAAAIGVSTRTVNRWKLHGIPDQWADSAAIALGTHPVILWPGFLDET